MWVVSVTNSWWHWLQTTGEEPFSVCKMGVGLCEMSLYKVKDQMTDYRLINKKGSVPLHRPLTASMAL